MSQPTPSTLSTVWRYPIKSMMGEELNAAAITASGVLGDRAFALIDEETGKVVSAKNPKRWPDFFSYRAAYASPPDTGDLPPIWISLPSGQMVRSDEANVDARLSAALSRAVRMGSAAPQSPSLEQYWPEYEGQENEVSQEAVAGDAPAGSFFDYAALHLLTTGTIDRLRALYPQGRFEVRRFRPNIVIDTGGQEGFVENEWVGKTVRIGATVRIQVTDPCPRCVMPTLAQGDLPKDLGILHKGIMRNKVHVPFAGKALPSIGVYARVLSPGVIRRGDSVVVEL
jgi:MOSC domain-containing protein